MSLEATIHAVQGWLRASSRIVVLTGAGISTESGLPDFRGPQGLWTQLSGCGELSDIRYYMSDGEIRKKAWRQRLEMLSRLAEPNRGHLAIVEREQRGTLHARRHSEHRWIAPEGGHIAGFGDRGPWHGAESEVHEVCVERTDGGDAGACDRGRVRSAGLERSGILKSDTISFGEPLVPAVISRASVPPRPPICFSRSARACRSIPSRALCRQPMTRARAWSFSMVSRRRSTRWLMRSWERRSARRCRDCWSSNATAGPAIRLPPRW